MLDKTIKRLLETGLITPQHLQFALDEQLRTNESILKILIDNTIISEARVKDAMEIYELEDIKITEINIPPSVIKMLPLHIIKTNKVFPIKFENNVFVLAMLDPKDLMAKDTVSIFLGKGISIQRYKITEDELDFLINKFSGLIAKDRESEIKLEEVSNENKDSYLEDSINKLINKMLVSSVNKKASQISIEPGSEDIRIRFKVYDSFFEEARIPKKIYPNFLLNLKQRANLEGEEKNNYYSGNFKFTSPDKKENNFVINGIKTINGEKITLRASYPIPDLKNLLYHQESFHYVEKLVSKNKGLIVVIGDSGSGKSTTLYSILQHKISNTHQLMTIEDTIKYIFDNYVSQIQLKSDKNYSSKELVREVLKHNPDVLMVQDVKDESWITLIEELALSGMLILAGMRSYNTLSAFNRLKRMGFPNFSSIQCVINQKLLRKLCPYCKTKSSLTQIDKDALRINIDINDIYQANHNGCSKCTNGYIDLIGLFEIVKMNKDLVKLLNSNDYYSEEVGKAINESCIISMKEYGLSLLSEGVISIDELKKTMGV
jgi:type II secretory ATPase GspE/PulE/Tfp pilus assembly ATPase PilB-like protein